MQHQIYSRQNNYVWMLRCDNGVMHPGKLPAKAFQPLQTMLPQPLLPHSLQLYDCPCKAKYATFGLVLCDGRQWILPICLAEGGFHPPQYLQLGTWSYPRNFSEFGSICSYRKTDSFISELIVSYPFPLFPVWHKLTLWWLRLLVIDSTEGYPGSASYDWIDSMSAIMFTVHIFNIISKQILIISSFISLYFRNVQSYPPTAARVHCPYESDTAKKKKK